MLCSLAEEKKQNKQAITRAGNGSAIFLHSYLSFFTLTCYLIMPELILSYFVSLSLLFQICMYEINLIMLISKNS